jgi:hypothetical protein
MKENYLIVNDTKQPILNCIIPRSLNEPIIIDLPRLIFENANKWIERNDVTTIYLDLCGNKYTARLAKVKTVSPIRLYDGNGIRISIEYSSFVKGIDKIVR